MKKVLIAVLGLILTIPGFGEIPNYTIQTMNPLDSFMKGYEQGGKLKQDKLQDSKNPVFMDNSPTTKENFCGKIQTIATSVMKARQLGYQPSFLYQKLGEGEPFDSMIKTAFQYPIKNNVESKLTFSKEFGNAYYFSCKQAVK